MAAQSNSQLSKKYFFMGRKKMLFVVVGLLILLTLFIPFGGKSFLDRFFKRDGVVGGNLIPNPSFEKGSGDSPEGWTTESRMIVD